MSWSRRFLIASPPSVSDSKCNSRLIVAKGKARSAEEKSDRTHYSRNMTSNLATQQALRARCTHPSGAFVEFTNQEALQSVVQRFEEQVHRHPDRLALKTRAPCLHLLGVERRSQPRRSRPDRASRSRIGNSCAAFRKRRAVRCGIPGRVENRQDPGTPGQYLPSNQTQLHVGAIRGRRCRDRQHQPLLGQGTRARFR